ncbi:MAG: DUF3037 domain-containing protein [Dehalococcoidia bacterium]
MKLFSYSIIRYVADVVRDEAVNVGVIVVSDSDRDGRCLLLPRFEAKIHRLDQRANTEPVSRLLGSLKRRVGAQYQANLFVWDDERITSTAQLRSASQALANQVQITLPSPYRAVSLRSAARRLLQSLVGYSSEEQIARGGMSLDQLNDLIRDNIAQWSGKTLTGEEAGRSIQPPAEHFADFWVQRGEDMVAVIAISADPQERQAALLRRDAVPTLVRQFMQQSPNFRAVVVLPPQTGDQTDFIAATARELRATSGVVVTWADEFATLAWPSAERATMFQTLQPTGANRSEVSDEALDAGSGASLP